MQKLKPFLKYFRNFYIVVGGAAIFWMIFFDRYNLVNRVETHFRIVQLEKDLQFYQGEKERLEHARSVLENSPADLETYAREEYSMKKANEDLFLIVD